MKIFDWYVFRSLGLATLFVSIILAVIIFLTQSLRFLELVIDSGASSSSFWILTFLALPRFFEIILPIALMSACVFIYNRMTMDSELVVVRSVGYSPLSLARPALVLAMIVTVILWGITMWAAPKSVSSMHAMHQQIKAQFSNMMFREGVFNQVSNGLTVYLAERDEDGEMRGLMIHDSRDNKRAAATILAKRGVIVMKDDTYQVVVYDGSRQAKDPETGALQRLNFQRYTIDLPDGGPVKQRWAEANERTFFELLNPNMKDERDVRNLRSFTIEIHRRFISPFLALVFTLISCCALLLGPLDRRGQGKRIAVAIGMVVVIQGLFLVGFNMARRSDLGIVLVYLLVFIPLGFSGYLLSGIGDRFRRNLLYREEASS